MAYILSWLGNVVPEIPFDLPDPGESLVISATNKASDLAVTGFTGSDIDYSIYHSYSGPVYVPAYSPLGCVFYCCTGGHQHGDFTGGIGFDITDITFKMHEHNNGGTRYSPAPDVWFDLATESTGAPYYEIIGNGVPCPGHGYQNSVYLSPADGGGTKGSILVVGRTAMGELGTTTSKSVYAFDIATGLWSRVTNNLASRAGNETGVCYDEGRGRYWYFTRDNANLDSFIPYLRKSDWTWQTDASFSGFPPGQAGGGGRAWMHEGKVFLQAGDGGLLGFDPDNSTAGINYVTISGSAGSSLPNNLDKFCYYPRTGKFYHITRAGGTTLNRLTPPVNPLSGTWTHDTVTVSPGLTATEFTTSHYNALIYVPAPVDRILWLPGGNNSPQVLDPA